MSKSQREDCFREYIGAHPEFQTFMSMPNSEIDATMHRAMDLAKAIKIHHLDLQDAIAHVPHQWQSIVRGAYNHK
jgi:hypothetical protein